MRSHKEHEDDAGLALCRHIELKDSLGSRRLPGDAPPELRDAYKGAHLMSGTSRSLLCVSWALPVCSHGISTSAYCCVPYAKRS